ncbi:MAG TPA: DUF5615 family PIN-like protein [Chloroflexota bacterium]
MPLRLLLDAHVSGRVIAPALRAEGHDVVAINEEPLLDSIEDRQVLGTAAKQQRILVTFDKEDFPDILREWAEAGLQHAGCVILVGIDPSEFGLIVGLLRQAFSRFPEADAWVNLPLILGRSGLQN